MARTVFAFAVSLVLGGCSGVQTPSDVPSTAPVTPAPAAPVASPSFSAPAMTTTPTPISLPTGPIVEQRIVDRSGVPAALYDTYWTVERTWQTAGQAGQIGTTARIVLPPEEELVGADDGRVASYVAEPDTTYPIVGPDGMAIIFETSDRARCFGRSTRRFGLLMG
jgi:hypothetical protein